MLTLLLLLPSAPAPVKGAPAPVVRTLPRECECDWGGAKYLTHFEPPGKTGWGLYQAWNESTVWVGRWRLRRGVLTVEERCMDGGWVLSTWHGRLRQRGRVIRWRTEEPGGDLGPRTWDVTITGKK
jgi:hypothetical protein